MRWRDCEVGWADVSGKSLEEDTLAEGVKGSRGYLYVGIRWFV